MYKLLIRPLLFRMDPERVHHLVAGMLRGAFALPGLAAPIRRLFTLRDPRLERELFGLRFPNPVGMAAGFDKEARLYNPLSHFGFGHVEVGTVTPEPQPGNPRPRLFRLPADQALINRMGFNNHGLKAFIENMRRHKPRVIIGGNIGKNTLTPMEQAAADYCRCFRELFPYVDYFTVNVSCPNIAGLSQLQDKDELVSLLRAIQEINRAQAAPRPVLLKISPDLTREQLDEVLEVVRLTGLSGIIATNTSRLREGLKSPPTEVAQCGQGGLSGAPLRDKATATIAYLHRQSGGGVPLIASGGVITPEDALEKLRAGASLVQVYTGFIYEGPSQVKRILKAILRSGL
jgi:dihydroorotate dehydrogenase